MKKSVSYALLFSVLFAPSLTLAQVAEVPLPTAEVVAVPAIDVAPQPEIIIEPVFLTGPVITVVEPIAVPNAALDVVYCADKFIISGGTYDQFSRPVQQPTCTTRDLFAVSYASVDFGITNAFPVRHLEVNPDGKVVFNEQMKFDELVNRVVQGETDPQMYLAVGGAEFGYLTPISENSVSSMFGANYKDQIIYFDDSIIYTYKIVK